MRTRSSGWRLIRRQAEPGNKPSLNFVSRRTYRPPVELLRRGWVPARVHKLRSPSMGKIFCCLFVVAVIGFIAQTWADEGTIDLGKLPKGVVEICKKRFPNAKIEGAS